MKSIRCDLTAKCTRLHRDIWCAVRLIATRRIGWELEKKGVAFDGRSDGIYGPRLTFTHLKHNSVTGVCSQDDNLGPDDVACLFYVVQISKDSSDPGWALRQTHAG